MLKTTVLKLCLKKIQVSFLRCSSSQQNSTRANEYSDFSQPQTCKPRPYRPVKDLEKHCRTKSLAQCPHSETLKMNNVPLVAADLSKVLNGFDNTCTVEYQVCGHVKTFRKPIKDVADLRTRTIDHLRNCLPIKDLLAQSQTGVVSFAIFLPEDFVEIYSVKPERATSENSRLKREMVAPPDEPRRELSDSVVSYKFDLKRAAACWHCTRRSVSCNVLYSCACKCLQRIPKCACTYS